MLKLFHSSPLFLKKINVNFITLKKKIQVQGEEEQSLFEVARSNNIPLDAICEGNCSCGTCHVYVANNFLGKLKPKEQNEEDTLSLSKDVKENSRLACQVKLTSELDGITVTIAKN